MFFFGFGDGGSLVVEKIMFANVRVAQPSQGVLNAGFDPES